MPRAPGRRTPGGTPRLHRGLSVPLPEGGRLRADRAHPAGDPRAPLVLLRTPYGRRPLTWLMRLLAERGYQSLAVSLRGTGGSSGRFTGWRLHPGDTDALLAWLRAQPWFPGAFATWGASFLGYAQWEMARRPVPEWRAALIQDAPPEFYAGVLYRGGAFALGDWLRWADQTRRITGGRTDTGTWRALRATRAAARRAPRAAAHLPLHRADRAAAHRPIALYQEWVRNAEPGPAWGACDHRANAAHLPPLVHLAGGWHDVFLPGVLEGYAALRGAGRDVRLLVGPWPHGWGLFTPDYHRAAFAVLDHALRGAPAPADPPVRLFVTGAGHWADLPGWPPPGTGEQSWYAHPGGVLATAPPACAPPSRLRYDPADPTPALGGPLLYGGGAPDSRPLAARPDVLAFTGPRLEHGLTAAGPLSAEVAVRLDGPSADVYARLCDVDPQGAMTHVSDGLVRLAPAEPGRVRTARVDLWPLAHRFAAGHRLALLLAGGAFPRYDRNLGTGRRLGTAMRPVRVEVLHDPEHPSVLRLPLSGSG
ncbi:CocE/NonD family hydrolase [Streptomonospora nanhaiensis]|uniref:CocE/NonD family hydrolase n=1 Tax=Streptomonospora nanhaiensis TaxID=1323731 RepID=UPI001C393C2C|nr:CocE/NonD family hydrolase [Streptomonospora nanhaiensis]MBV2363173.1 CocE/NonD family hydrolase [Streptomonospora nanhaiensis]MBX9387447.1 CocE/NonD family hydrolase [Streptomonospora nanhaiensis]